MTYGSLSAFELLKAATLVLLAVLLFSLGSATHPTSAVAYLAFTAIMLLQGAEIFAPAFCESEKYPTRQIFLLRISIMLQVLLASALVAATDGSGSIYELVYLLPIISAATKLSGQDVTIVVFCSVLAMIGFIITGEQLTPTITRVKEFQDAVAAMVYFTMTGLLTYFFVKAERDQRMRYQDLASALTRANAELRQTQAELTERLGQVANMEERIQRISQMAAMGELAAQVAHEVRNPLGIIKGAADMLAARVSDPSTQRHIAVLLEEVNHLNKAVDGVLRLGAPLGMKIAEFDLADLLRSVTRVASAWSLSNSAQIRLVLGSEPIVVFGDHDLLHQAFTNIVRNACEAMPDGGTVTMTAQLNPDERVTIAVSDTGSGLSAHDIKRLGEPFFSKRPGGVGLGVSLARRIVSEHGGSLAADSILGQGTIVTIHLPAAKPVSEQSIAADVRRGS